MPRYHNRRCEERRWPAGVFLNLASQHLNTVIIALRYNKITPCHSSERAARDPRTCDTLRPPYSSPFFLLIIIFFLFLLLFFFFFFVFSILLLIAFYNFAFPTSFFFSLSFPSNPTAPKGRVGKKERKKEKNETTKQEIIGGLKMIFSTVDASPPAPYTRVLCSPRY